MILCSVILKLLGITSANKLKFKKPVDDLCKKASTCPQENKRILANEVIDSQFNYAPLIWIFAGKILINKICKIHHRSLQVIYNEYNKPYEELLQLNNNMSIHQRYLQYLAFEVLNPLCMQIRNFCGSTLMRTLFRMT